MQHFINMLAFQNFLIEKIQNEHADDVGSLNAEIEDLQSEIETLEEEIGVLNGKIDDLEAELPDDGNLAKRALPLLKDIGKPGEYGSLEQRAWDIYHDFKHLEVER